MTNTSLNSINYVVGFDLGHGETALSGVNLKSEHKKEKAFNVEVNGKSNFTTAIGYHPEHGIFIGDKALTTEGVTESYLAFKQRPTDDHTYRKTMQDYIGYIYRVIKDRHGFTDDNTFFLIGCPTDWYKDKDVVINYESIFQSIGMRRLKVVPESRGALMDGIESGDILATVGELRGRALVVDLGSSTADFTFIALERRKAEPLDFGHDLGASLIDKLIFRHFLNASKQKEKLISIFKKYSYLRNRCEFACRNAKESWFENPNIISSETVEIIADELYFTAKVEKKLMEQILNEPLIDLKDTETLFDYPFQNLPETNWPQELEKQLLYAQGSGGEPDIVLLTGGASRMYFVSDLCKKIFPEVKIVRGQEPEYSIANGLAYWGRVDIRSKGFEGDIESVLDKQLTPAIENKLPEVFQKLAEYLTDDVMNNVAKPAIEEWKNTSESVSILKQNLDSKTNQWGKSAAVVNHINSALSEPLVQVAKDLNTDHFMEIAQRYEIPNSRGALDISNAVGIIFRGNVSSDRLPTIIDQTDLEEAVNTVKEEIEKETNDIVLFISAVIVGSLILVGIGLIISLIIGILALIYGTEKAKEMAEEVDIPIRAKKKIDFNGKLEAKRQEVVSEIKTQLEKNPEVRKSIVHSGRQAIRSTVRTQVENVRVFIE